VGPFLSFYFLSRPVLLKFTVEGPRAQSTGKKIKERKKRKKAFLFFPSFFPPRFGASNRGGRGGKEEGGEGFLSFRCRKGKREDKGKGGGEEEGKASFSTIILQLYLLASASTVSPENRGEKEEGEGGGERKEKKKGTFSFFDRTSHLAAQ